MNSNNELTTLILPAAGKSTRYNGVAKWILNLPSGNIMLHEAICNLDLVNVSKIVITVCRYHVFSQESIAKYIKKIEEDTDKEVQLVTLNDWTFSQPHTVSETIKRANITGPFCVRDCDSIFNAAPEAGNFVATSQIQVGVRADNKGYVTTTRDNVIDKIVEKKIISNTFVAGLYGFQEAAMFNYAFDVLNHVNHSLFMTDVVKHLINTQCQRFITKPVENYIDLGELADWEKYIRG